MTSFGTNADRRPSERRPLRLPLYLALTWASVFWERLRPALGIGLGLSGLFLVLALADVLPLLPGWLHMAALIFFGVAIVLAIVLGLRRVVPPTRDDAERRLELESGLEHRPLQAMRDFPTLGNGKVDPAVAALWRLHQRRARTMIGALRIVLPRIGVERRDPLYPQIGLLLALGLVLAMAWGDVPGRLTRAVTPSFGAAVAELPPAYDLWIDPPSYTGAPPVFLHVADDLAPADSSAVSTERATPDGAMSGRDTVTVPEKSRVLGRLQGSAMSPELRIGEVALPFEGLEPGLFVLETELSDEGMLTLSHDGAILGEWEIALVPDRAPEIRFSDPPGRTERAALRLPYAAQDDYGIVSARAVVRLNADEAVMAGAEEGERDEGALEALRSEETISLDLPVASGGREAIEGIFYEDLSSHLWAGLPVSVTLEATDAAGQVGRSDTVATILPEREFKHPVARLLVEQRRALFLEPDKKGKVVATLFRINKAPEAFGNDTVVFMAIRSAILRLMRRPDATVMANVQQLLWDTALHIEDGRVSIASRDLRDAQRALRDALSRGADDEEIEQLMNQLQEAINRFLDAMEEQMANQLQSDDLEDMQTVNPGDMQTVDRGQLQEMLDQARELSRSGAKDAAQQMLSQLQEMLENLQTAPMVAQPSPRNERAMEMMRGLDTLMDQQQDLLDRTFREARRQNAERQRMRDMFNPRMPNMTMPGMPRAGRPGQMGRQQPGRGAGQQSGQGSMGQQQGGQQQGGRAPNSTEQEALRRILGELMRNLGEMMGEIPAPLGRAERAMRDASRSLEGNQPGEATGSQTEALDQLQAGARAMAEQMQQQMQGQPGMGQIPSRDPGTASQQTDPLGRQLPDGARGAARGHVDIPSKSEIQKSREILRELHRRAGERARPRLERDYIDRLLERF